MGELTEISSAKCFDGYQKIFEHQSAELKCSMKFAVYLPPAADKTRVPVLYWLSGLECTEQNFVQKSGAQRYASEHGIVIVCPDTSPRGCNIEGENDSWDFGTGAGFYVDATEPKWAQNYRMYSYVTGELPKLVDAHFPTIPGKKSISGHSMGGHGALTCFLKNPGMYCSVSAFAPICNPMECSWGRKALSGYLGCDTETWKRYDATQLVQQLSSASHEHSILIDQGGADVFKEKGQLLPENFVSASAAKGVSVIYNLRPGYDHGYYFIATFIGDHIKHHATCLKK